MNGTSVTLGLNNLKFNKNRVEYRVETVPYL